MMPSPIVAGPRPVAVIGLLLCTIATAAFGNSLQSIAVLAWLQPIVLLLAYEGSVRTFRSSIVAHVAIILAQALGFSVAFAGALSYPTTTLSSLLTTLGLGTAIATATTLGALLPASRLRRLAAELLPAPLPPPPPPPHSLPLSHPHPHNPKPPLTPLGWLLLALPVWAYPVLQSAVFTLAGTQLGHFHEPGVALSDWPAVAQLASLFGLWGLNFGLSLVASAACCVATSEALPLTPAAAAEPPPPPGSFSEAAAASGGGGGRWSRLCRPLRRHVLCVAWVLWLLAVVGGGLVYNDSFYQRPVGQRLGHERRLPVSCLAAESADVGSEAYVWLWSKTAERVAAGDRIVLWSEEAVVVRTAAEEATLLAAGRDLLATHGSADPAAPTYLGVCYAKLLLAGEIEGEKAGFGAGAAAGSGAGTAGPGAGGFAGSAAAAVDAVRRSTAELDPRGVATAAAAAGDSGMGLTGKAAGGTEAAAAAAATGGVVGGGGGAGTAATGGGGGGGSAGAAAAPPRMTNHFVLLGPNRTVLWDYRKAFPVPVVEANVVAGARRLPTAPSPYGMLGGAICFDMDRPQYVRQAGATGVELLLQPSWTWGAVGPRHFASNALRAIENGFTTFRCSSDGVSGVVSPRGVAAHYLLTGERDVHAFSLPLQPRARTAYAAAGWALEWANLAAAAALLALLAAPRARLARWVAWSSRGGGGDGGDGVGGEWAGGRHQHQYQQRRQQQQEPLLQHS